MKRRHPIDGLFYSLTLVVAPQLLSNLVEVFPLNRRLADRIPWNAVETVSKSHRISCTACRPFPAARLSSACLSDRRMISCASSSREGALSGTAIDIDELRETRLGGCSSYPASYLASN